MPESGHRNDGEDTTRGAVQGDAAWLDRAMLEGVRRRDAGALRQFFDVSFPYVYGLAMRLLGNRENAEDVTQEVFLKVYRAADRLDVNRHPKPWLTTIVYNACRDAARRTSARPETTTDPVTIAGAPGTTATPEEVFDRREREALVEHALMELDEASRASVFLYDFCGLSHEEVADAMSMSHAAARKRYSRALKQMAEIIRRLQQ